MKLYIGIEGIATRFSVAVVSDETGHILSARRLPQPLSLHTMDEQTLRQGLGRLMENVLHPVGRELDDLSDSTICIGLSGTTFPYNESVDVPKLFEDMGVNAAILTCLPDTHIIFPSHTQSERGGVIVCGKGSMAYAATPSGGCRVGGWGPAIGDEGSGFWMGRTVLRAIGRETDEDRPPSTLWAEVTQFLSKPSRPKADWLKNSIKWRQVYRDYEVKGYDPRTAIFSFAHDISLDNTPAWRSLASSLVIPLMDAWRNGDRIAEAIVNSAKRELVSQFRAACHKAGASPKDGPVVLYGGVLTHNPDFRALIARYIEHKCNCSIETIVAESPEAMRPACGALLLALGGSKPGDLQLPSHEIIQRVKAEQRRWGDLVND